MRQGSITIKKMTYHLLIHEKSMKIEEYGIRKQKKGIISAGEKFIDSGRSVVLYLRRVTFRMSHHDTA